MPQFPLAEDGRARQIAAMSSPSLTLIRLPHGDGIALPGYETAGAAGMQTDTRKKGGMVSVERGKVDTLWEGREDLRGASVFCVVF